MADAGEMGLAPTTGSGAVAPANSGERYGLDYTGDGLSYFLLVLKHILLTIVTLGIYAPWAKAEKRVYVWQNIKFHGQALRYHGTGMELFIAYLKVFAVYFGVSVVMAIAQSISQGAALLVQLLFGVTILVFLPGFILGARRYILSRTSWRGVRFGLRDVSLFSPFTGLWIGGYLLSILTLGLYVPVWQNNIRRYVTNRTMLGSESFRYTGENSEIFWIYLKGLALTILTLGIYGGWFQASLLRYQYSHIHFQNARARLDITGVDIWLLTLLQIFGTLLTLGLGLPWVLTYTFKFFAERMHFEGDIDFNRIAQSELSGDATAEGFSDALDVGIGL